MFRPLFSLVGIPRQERTHATYKTYSFEPLLLHFQVELAFKYAKKQLLDVQWGEYMSSIRVASKYRESIHMYRLCIGYVSVILYAGRDGGTRKMGEFQQGISKG